MTKLLLSSFLLLSTIVMNAQSTAQDFNKMDCNGTAMHHLFADLDSGHAVLLHYFMPSCGSCPPAAKVMQRMAKGINAMYPGMVIGYAMPFNNTTACSYSKSWVTSNGLSTIYTPLDSGDASVAYYGGFGMPTVVVLGGKDHHVIYASQSFSAGDTTAIRDSILGMMKMATAINELPRNVALFNVYPNPSTDMLHINISLTEVANLSMELVDMTGRVVAVVLAEQTATGLVSTPFDIKNITSGMYLLRATVDHKTVNQQVTILH